MGIKSSLKSYLDYMLENDLKRSDEEFLISYEWNLTFGVTIPESINIETAKIILESKLGKVAGSRW